MNILPDYASTSHANRSFEIYQPAQSGEVIFKGRKRPPKKPYVLPLPICCLYCGAKLFRNESINFCCSQGDIRLAQNTVPTILRHLFLGNDANAYTFRKFVLFYNSSFAFTSYGVKKDPDLTHRNRGIYTFRVQGQFYHFINDVLPTQEQPRYIQLYFFDTDAELWHRLQSSPDLTQIVVSTLVRIMDVNPYAKFFRSLREVGIDEESCIVIRADPTQDQRTHNAPTSSQVAAIWVDDEASLDPMRHDIIVYARSGVSHRVRHYYGCYDPLQYPLLFPYGDTGWHRCIYKCSTSFRRREGLPTFPINEVLVQTADDLLEAEDAVARSAESDKKVSCREYYCYRLQIRPKDSSILLRCGRLLQQYIVDMYIKLESTRLDFFRTNQAAIRADLYQGVIDSYNAGQTHGANIGQIYILPASFIGCDRDLRCRYLSAMSLVQRYGKPDIFLTMTCNPKWPEIERELLPHEEAQNRPDLVARVFRAKLIEVKKEIVEKKLFGSVAGYVYVVEFQKRGLPHAHFLIILDAHSKIRSPDQYDALVSAEIPDMVENPHLYGVVLRHMMHGPCGREFPTNPCMKNGNCKNHYPRDYAEMTTNGRNSYPIYRRRQDGKSAIVRTATLDNRWVVPYNPFLLAKYDCHLNVEVCSTIKAVKYLYKYVYKGHDRVSFTVEDSRAHHEYDEIKAFQSARWISPPEAAWRIFRFCLNEIHPNVVALQVHLPNMQTVLFRSYERLDAITDDDQRKRTMLTTFFERNQTDSYARTLLYQQFPEYYIWLGQKDEKIWFPRRKGFAIGRLVYTSPTEGERYYLRMLLANVRGPQSFEDLLTVNNVSLSSFQEAAYQRGLLEDDNSVENSLLEASHFQMPFALRRLFATLLIYCAPKSPRLLWERFFSALSEDYALAFPENPRRVLNLTLRCISSIIESMGKKFSDFDFRGLHLEDDESESQNSKEIEDQLRIPITLEDLNTINLLNVEQKQAYQVIYNRVVAKKPGAFFVDGPGGTGKTFLYSALLAQVRKKGFIALAVASSGIAAANISGGRTANSLFKIPLNLDENQSSMIPKQSGLAELIRISRLIIWDEAPMAKRQSIEHFERTLRDICSKNKPFGGKIVVFGGDFRQVLPVIPKSTLREAVNASLVMSPLWPKLEKIRLTINMRAINDPAFSEFVLRVGEGCPPYENGKDITLPRAIVLKSSQQLSLLQQLIESIYPDVDDVSLKSLLTTRKAILTPKNDDTEAINSLLVSRQRGKAFEYKSFDEAADITTEQYPIEFLNTLNPGGLPPHRLVLKKNSPILLLRNLDPTSGLCNGTRLICRSFSKNIIEAEIVVGHHKGERVFLPRIPLQPSPADKFPFSFKRKQFPIMLSFAMTINKSQGQTLDKVGIYLPQPVFSHGQLYVALSRAKRSSDVVVAVASENSADSSSKTKNIVCYEVLRRAGIL